MRTTETRLRRLEHAVTPRRVVVVRGHSEAEHDAKVTALKARGEASERDLIVCVWRFSDPVEGERA